jgi:hypothetical protein
MYRSSGDRSWLEAAKVMLETLEHRTKVQCGFAGLSGSEVILENTYIISRFSNRITSKTNVNLGENETSAR